MTKGKPLSGAVIKAFFEGSDAQKIAEKVAQAEGSRLQYLFRTFPESSIEQVKAAVKDYKALSKNEHGDDKGAAKVATARTAEVQSLYGAWRFADFKPDGMGYHPAVAAARAALKQIHVRWTGDKIPEKWERDVRKEVENTAQVELAARMEIERATRSGKELTDEEQEAIREKAAEQQVKAGMVELARALYKKYGAEQCGWLIDSLEATITAGEQEAKDKAAEKQKAAA